MKDNYLWVLEEKWNDKWYPTDIVAQTREACRTRRDLEYYRNNTRIRKYIRQEK